MAGRGRGRGSQFGAIQDSLGLGRGQIVEPSNFKEPPPIYPPLGNRPHFPQKEDYMLAVMKDFVNHMRDSQFAIAANEKSEQSKGIVAGRYSEKFQNIVSKPLTGIDWKRYPKELCPSTSDKKSTKRQKSTPKPRVPTKKSKVENPDDLLDKLEKAEKNDKGNEGSDAEGSDNDDDDNESTKNEEIEEDEPDEEMDDGTDYANNYFDNGDGYLDEEEDNIDEGGIY